MRLSLPPARSLRNKLALVFFGITGVAFAAIFFIVVPQLRSNLESQRLKELQRIAPAFTSTLESAMNSDINSRQLDELVRSVADSSDAEVTIFGVQRSSGPPDFYAISNSHVSTQVDASAWLVRRAYLARRIRSAVTTVNDERTAQAAVPLRLGRRPPEWMAVYTRSLADVNDTVSLITTRVLIASGVAILISLIGGYLVAGRLARRVSRLELSAKGVAAGHFRDPLPVDSGDELGQLTRTFNEMQFQLARVEGARREFIANASHELRTPIFSLGGFVELLQDEDLDEETRAEFLGLMSEQVDRLQKLSVSLLDLSRLDAGSLELNPEEVDLSELAREVAGEFTPALTSHHARLELKLPDDEVEAVCDRERVAQIMRILLDNALRHTPEGTQVTVTADRDNGAAELTVADTGPGVPAPASGRVFERFYTGDAARGSGLGLAIARELADRMSGEIKLDSRPGRTAFTLALPIAEGNGSA